MCVCDEIGKDRMLDATLTFDDERAAKLVLTIIRTDRWAAELRAIGYKGTRYQTECYPAWPTGAIVWEQEDTFIKTPINYCPKCGRRLSLADASRREDI